jgi:3-oxoacyl-[acyl-carrier protein] reductase
MGMLEGKVALITGAGRGIGAATAFRFATEGAAVVITDLDAHPINEVTEAIRNAGGRVHAIIGDLTETSFPEKVIQETIAIFGTPDIIINNAGYNWDAAFHMMSDAQWQAMLDIHMNVPFQILRAAFPVFYEAIQREQINGEHIHARKVINISSVAALSGNAGQANYAAAKAGIIGLTKSLAREWGRYNIQVNCACFGYIDTRLSAIRGNDQHIDKDETITLGISPTLRQRAPSMIALGRFGTPEEAAGSLLFFASSLSDYVTGQVLEVSGGLLH